MLTTGRRLAVTLAVVGVLAVSVSGRTFAETFPEAVDAKVIDAEAPTPPKLCESFVTEYLTVTSKGHGDPGTFYCRDHEPRGERWHVPGSYDDRQKYDDVLKRWRVYDAKPEECVERSLRPGEYYPIQVVDGASYHGNVEIDGVETQFWSARHPDWDNEVFFWYLVDDGNDEPYLKMLVYYALKADWVSVIHHKLECRVPDASHFEPTPVCQ